MASRFSLVLFAACGPWSTIRESGMAGNGRTGDAWLPQIRQPRKKGLEKGLETPISKRDAEQAPVPQSLPRALRFPSLGRRDPSRPGDIDIRAPPRRLP